MVTAVVQDGALEYDGVRKERCRQTGEYEVLCLA